MASASTTEVFKCSPEQFFSIITDYEKYPEFLPEVNKCEVVDTESDRQLVEFEISIIKNFTYRLWMEKTPSTELSWSFDSGELFKSSIGKWILSSVDAGPGFLIVWRPSLKYLSQGLWQRPLSRSICQV